MMHSHHTPSIAVAIPVKNGFPEIQDCIEGLLKQTIRPARIYVMDSGSTDGTLDYLHTIPEVQVIPVVPAEFNHGETRNLGWQHAREDFVLYTVQDARAATNTLLEELMKGFDDPGVMAVCGQQVVPHEKDKNPVEWFRPVSTPKTRKYQFADPDSFEALSPQQKNDICSWDDVVALYRREALENLPFRRVVFGEDMLWARDAMRKGFTIEYRPAAQVYHDHQEDPDFSFKRALTTRYFRYRNFGNRPSKPVLTLRRKLSMGKSIMRSVGLVPSAWLRWYLYNLAQQRAYLRAFNVFTESLSRGEQALDETHEQYCGKPHLVKKSHERSQAAG